MNAQVQANTFQPSTFQPKTLVRLVVVIVVACVAATLLAGPRTADAASDGYGVTAVAFSAQQAPVMEGRSALILPDLK